MQRPQIAFRFHLRINASRHRRLICLVCVARRNRLFPAPNFMRHRHSGAFFCVGQRRTPQFAANTCPPGFGGNPLLFKEHYVGQERGGVHLLGVGAGFVLGDGLTQLGEEAGPV